jgi:hypothetical protein
MIASSPKKSPAMHPDHKAFLSLAFTPGRFDSEQTAWFLGFQPHDIPVLIAAGLLRPLGRPRPNSVKYFAAVDLEALRTDPKWLSKATDVVQTQWRRKNGAKSKAQADMGRSIASGRQSAGEEEGLAQAG